jgi:type I restriction enzyme S subunit
MELKKYKLGDIAETYISSIDKKSKEGEQSVRLCNFVDIYHNWAITKDLVPNFMIASANDNNIKRFSLKEGYVAFTKDSETRDDIGIPAYIADDLDNTVLGYHCALVKPNADILSGKYLNTFLHSDYIKKYFELNATGSGMRYTLSTETLSNIPILVPSLEMQEYIGNIFSNIDRKICLNRQINDNLEAMAKQLYEYWFVQFDFPNEEDKPYKSSGGTMVWNEKLKREIPQGWSNGVLSDVANITMGQSPDGSSYNEDGEGIIFYQGSTDFGLRFPDIRQYTTSPSRYANKGDILMSVRAPVGALNIANNDCCIGRGLSALSSKIGSMTHLYYLMNDFRLKFEGMNSAGTTFGSITKDELFSLPVIIPTKSVISEFEQVCEPIFDKQMIIGEEINGLTKQRDELLPLLMNGQATVNYHLSDD